MSNYEKRFQKDGSYKIYEIKNRRYIVEDHVEYVAYLENGGEVTDVPYVEPTPPTVHVPTLEEIKTSKKNQIKHSHDMAYRNPCVTSVVLKEATENEEAKYLTVNYGYSDRDKWFKGIIGAGFECIQTGKVKIINSYDDPTESGNYYILSEDFEWARNGSISPGFISVMKDFTTVVRDYYNDFQTITIGQMHQAALCQNLQMEADLRKKWELEELVNNANTKEEVEAINW